MRNDDPRTAASFAPPGEANRDAGTAADNEHALGVAQRILDLVQMFLFGDDHGISPFGCAIWGRRRPSGLGPNCRTVSSISVTASAQRRAIADDMLNIFTRSGSIPIWRSSSWVWVTRRLALKLPCW